MTQFDVHRNRGQNQDAIPYVVIVQSSIFDEYRRRVVIPLVKKSYLGSVSLPRLNPTFEIEQTAVVLNPFEIVSIANNKLGPFVQSLADEGQQIFDSLDELLTRAHG